MQKNIAQIAWAPLTLYTCQCGFNPQRNILRQPFSKVGRSAVLNTYGRCMVKNSKALLPERSGQNDTVVQELYEQNGRSALFARQAWADTRCPRAP
jgi:hypothetical protein